MPKSLDDRRDDRREGAANHQAYRAQLEAYQAKCEECLQQLLAIENQIRRVAHWLRFAQPAYSTGRISIRWWLNDRSGIRHPHLVRWLRTVDGERMKPVPYKRRPRKLPDYGAFAVCHDLAERLVDVYFDLTAQRAKVLDHFRRLTSLRHARGPVVDLSSHSAAITEIGQQIEARLKAHDIMPPEPEPELTSKESVHE